jgi:hypothetical protein
MRKLVSAALGSAAIVTLCLGMMVMNARPSHGTVVECTWGQLKCCYSDITCSGCCHKKGVRGPFAESHQEEKQK